MILRQKASFFFIYVSGFDNHRDCGYDVHKQFVRGLQVVNFKLFN